MQITKIQSKNHAMIPVQEQGMFAKKKKKKEESKSRIVHVYFKSAYRYRDKRLLNLACCVIKQLTVLYIVTGEAIQAQDSIAAVFLYRT